LAQVGVLVEDAIRVAQGAVRRLLANAAATTDVRALVGEEDRLPPAAEPGELVDHSPEPPNAEDGLAEVEVEDVVLVHGLAEEGEPPAELAPQRVIWPRADVDVEPVAVGARREDRDVAREAELPLGAREPVCLAGDVEGRVQDPRRVDGQLRSRRDTTSSISSA
jgi:hypothetical protein